MLPGCREQVLSCDQILATWLNDSSTGVSRPKIETSTLSFWVSGLISEIVAGRGIDGPFLKGPASPTSHEGGVPPVPKTAHRTPLALARPPAAKPPRPGLLEVGGSQHGEDLVEA